VKRILQFLIRCGLSLLFLSGIVFVETHLHQHTSETSLYDIDNDSQNRHLFSHQCKECLNKNQRICISTIFDLSIDKKISVHVTSNTIIYVKSIIYDLHSHPPPKLS